MRNFSLLGVGLVFAFLLCRACLPEWEVNPQYGYGVVVPFLVIYLLGRKLSTVSEISVIPELRRRTIISVSLLMFVALTMEWGRLQHPPMRIVMGMQGLIWILMVTVALCDFPKDFWKSIYFPLLLLITAVPWPTRIEEPIIRGLMSWVTGIAVECLHLAGVVARREGELILFPNGIVGVSEACSGIRSLQAAFVFSLIVGEWRKGSLFKRFELFGVSLLMALLGNLTRTLTLSGLAVSGGMDEVDRWHDFSGSVLLLGLIGAIVGWSLWRIPEKEGDGSFFSGKGFLRFQHQPSGVMTSIFIVSLLVVFGMSFYHGDQKKRSGGTTKPSVQWRKGEGDRSVAISSETWRNLRATTGEWIDRKTSGDEGEKLEFYHFFWEPVRDSQGVRLHRPDWCMRGIGWKRRSDPERGVLKTATGTLDGYWIEYQKPGEEALQFWTLLRNREAMEIDFSAAALVDDFTWRRFLFPSEERSSWEMISVAISSHWIKPSREEVEQVTQQRIFQSPASTFLLKERNP